MENSKYLIPPAHMRALSGKTDQTKEVTEKCLKWLKEDSPFCILSGENGVGKTILACQMMLAWIKESEKSKEVTGEFLDLSLTYHKWLDEMRSGSVYKLLEKNCAIDIVIIDDMGVKMPSEGWREWLMTLINQRLVYEKRTIITTNLDSEQMQAYYGEALLSRIMIGTQIRIQGCDRRLSLG